MDLLRKQAAAMAELAELAPAGEVPRRVLDVGLGTGRHVADLLDVLPPHVELWGTDLSVGMLSLARHRFLRDPRQRAVRLLLADAHRLPFPDGFFDRVLHLGGTGGLRDPRPALAEMARVARPGAPVVVVVDRLDGGGPLRRWTFGKIADPHSALEALPETATDVQTRQLSHFYAGVRFRVA